MTFLVYGGGSLVAKSCLTLATPLAALSMGLSRQEYWSGFPFPFPGDLFHPGTVPRSPALPVYSLPTELERNSYMAYTSSKKKNKAYSPNKDYY